MNIKSYFKENWNFNVEYEENSKGINNKVEKINIKAKLIKI